MIIKISHGIGWGNATVISTLISHKTCRILYDFLFELLSFKKTNVQLKSVFHKR